MTSLLCPQGRHLYAQYAVGSSFRFVPEAGVIDMAMKAKHGREADFGLFKLAISKTSQSRYLHSEIEFPDFNFRFPHSYGHKLTDIKRSEKWHKQTLLVDQDYSILTSHARLFTVAIARESWRRLWITSVHGRCN